MSGIAELFGLRRTVGLTPEQERELFRCLRKDLLPRLAKRLAEPGEGAPEKRKAGGLPFAVEDYWQELMEKIHADRLWPGEKSIAVVTAAYLATCFRNYLNGLRRERAIDTVELPFCDDSEIEYDADGLAGDTEGEAAGQPGTAPDHRQGLGGEERSMLFRRYLQLAGALLHSHRHLPWLRPLIELQLEPIFLQGVDPMLKLCAARSMGVAPSTMTKYVQAFGLPSPTGRTTARWSETILGEWVTRQCGIADPEAERDKLLLALDALCRRNHELRRRMPDHE